MAKTRKPTRIDDVERARTGVEIETASLATTAVTMYLAALAQAEAAKRAGAEHDPLVPSTPLPDPAHLTAGQGATSPTDEISSAQPDRAGASPSALPADAISPAPAAQPQPWEQASQPAESAPFASDAPDANAAVGSAGVPGGQVFGGQVFGGQAFGGQPIPYQSPETSGAISHSGEPGPPDFGFAFADSMNESMAGLSNAMADLGASLQQQLTSLAPDLSGLGTAISSTVTEATGLALSIPASAADMLVSGVFGTGSAGLPGVSPDDEGALIDTGALVPVPSDLAPLQLGFLGQSLADAHNPHDGAFSALGIHTF
jgi:hypothetical protein